jgi:hypothetical protein
LAASFNRQRAGAPSPMTAFPFRTRNAARKSGCSSLLLLPGDRWLFLAKSAAAIRRAVMGLYRKLVAERGEIALAVAFRLRGQEAQAISARAAALDMAGHATGTVEAPEERIRAVVRCGRSNGSAPNAERERSRRPARYGRQTWRPGACQFEYVSRLVELGLKAKNRWI